MTTYDERTWLQRNKWGLILLIPALLLALLASSSRIQLFWWTYKLNEPVDGVQGTPTKFTDTFEDSVGTHRRSMKITVHSVDPSGPPMVGFAHNTPLPAPSGAEWITVHLAMDLDPTTPLLGCKLALRDAQGRDVTYDPAIIDVGTLPASPCAPEDTPGPYSMSPADQASAAEAGVRPATYDMATPMLVPAGFKPTEVRFWFTTPKYLRVKLK